MNSSKLCHNPLGEEDLEVSEEKLENDPVSEPDPEIIVVITYIQESYHGAVCSSVQITFKENVDLLKGIDSLGQTQILYSPTTLYRFFDTLYIFTT